MLQSLKLSTLQNESVASYLNFVVRSVWVVANLNLNRDSHNRFSLIVQSYPFPPYLECGGILICSSCKFTTPTQEWFTCQGFPGQWALSLIFRARPTFQLIFPRIHSHCAVFLEQAPSLSFWWTLSRTHCSFWASLTRSWHRCQMPSCSLGGKI